MCVLMEPASPVEARQTRSSMEQLTAISTQTGISANRLKEFWLLAWLISEEQVVAGKSWDDHRRALYRSDPRRGRYNVRLALGLLRHDELVTEEADPFEGVLKGKALVAARRIWRNLDDLNNPEAVKAVVEELRDQNKKGIRPINQLHATILKKIEEDKKLRERNLSDAVNIITTYHTQMLRTGDACIKLTEIFRDLPPELKAHLRGMLEGSALVTERALNNLLEALLD